MQVQVKHSRDHQGRREFHPYVDGQHAVVLEDESGCYRGELVWRLANIGQGIAEITGFGIADEANRRKGWGSLLLKTALRDIVSFMVERDIDPRLVYLFANGEDEVAKSFYEAREFRFLARVPGLYQIGTACLYVRNLELEESEN
jgi:ribosomal protein S18 acetylase RimI-like enzyme